MTRPIDLDERMPVRHALFTTASCALCGAEIHVQFEYQQRGLCGFCADAAANLFMLAHAGEPLTWREQRASGKPKPVPEPMRWIVWQRDGFKCGRCGSSDMLRAVPKERGADGDKLPPEAIETVCNRCLSGRGHRKRRRGGGE
ncbi:hypothetical protein [Parvibaculum sp.]|uniref:hypothetical protein n=1 Tax=Parvibaculum sp. TaxID=2024848 RepID=UPI001D89C25A|nr:hypothetical protein [Parvibaculum sp.]MBX3488883.1 hypothetical protein [Parvibaculum sp.]